MDTIMMLIGLAFTLMIFSYLLGDNFFFRLAIYLFIGLTAGYFASILAVKVIWPRLLLPIIQGNLTQKALAVVPLVLCLLLLLKLFPKFSRLGNVSMGYLTGASAALVIGGAITGTLTGQLGEVINGFNRSVSADAPSTFVQLIFMLIVFLGTLTTLIYFHFGLQKKALQKPSRPDWMEWLAKTGQVFIAITFGAVYAGVLIASITALIDRMYFIKDAILLLF